MILRHLVSACSAPCAWADYYSWVLSSQCMDRKEREKRTRDRTSPTDPALCPASISCTQYFRLFRISKYTTNQLPTSLWGPQLQYMSLRLTFHIQTKTFCGPNLRRLLTLCLCFVVCFMCVWLVLGTLNSFGVDKKLILLS